MAGQKNCGKCGGRMSRGFRPDVTHGGHRTGTWVAGDPKKSIWTGLKLKNAEKVEVVTWRCDRCHYLEDYAPGR